MRESSSAAGAFAPTDSVRLHRALTEPDPPRRSRGQVARRGLAWGAVVGGVVGYFLMRDQEYGGAIAGPVFGAVIGAPIGMLVLLLATPVS